MKLIQFILLGVCMSMLFSSVGATTVYFGHLATRVGVDVGGGEIESLQELVDHNQFSAPYVNGCGENSCIAFYEIGGLNVVPTCIEILSFDKYGDSLPPILNENIAAPPYSDLTNGTYDDPQTEFEIN